ncbi:MAG: hypothetical protein M3Y76_01015 [Chloroflexota bacterium]|nr:hypothetical protein [Chloroflexota bacterium]
MIDANNGALHILVVGQTGQQDSEKGAADLGGTAGQRVDVGTSWTTPLEHCWHISHDLHGTSIDEFNNNSDWLV